MDNGNDMSDPSVTGQSTPDSTIPTPQNPGNISLMFRETVKDSMASPVDIRDYAPP